MTNPTNGHPSSTFWSAPLERVVVTALLCFVLLCVIAAVVILASHSAKIDPSATAILGSVAGSVGTAIVHRLTTRSTDRNGA